jgi:N-acetyl-gamma-glutamyl-phosphate reductase
MMDKYAFKETTPWGRGKQNVFMGAKLKNAVLGATGYSGLELTRLLGRHPRIEKPLLMRRGDGASPPGPPIAGTGTSNGNDDSAAQPFSWQALEQHGAELLFLATPHAVSREMVPEAIARGLRVIDLSGAWRLKQKEHRAVYGFKDADADAAAELDERAVYGLPELNSEQIKSAELVANPGCYATSVILALAPLLSAKLVDHDRGIISDSKSGVSGAGKEPTARTHFVSVADNFSAYSMFGHRHTGEILEQLGLRANDLTFTPHLLPIPRGILSTIYVHLKKETTAEKIESRLRKFYDGRKFVRIFPASSLPEIQFSVHTNYCDIGFSLGPDGHRLILVSCLDNLLKGAAGQAVQNMNLMYGWDETDGLQ